MNLFPDFYDTNKVQQIAINLFYGWGYNFFRKENQLRADSALIRDKTAEILGGIHTAMAKAETSYRLRMLPPPTRARPDHDPEALAHARELEALGRELGAMQGVIRAAPVPETDRMRQRYRDEARTLEILVEADQRTVGQAAMLGQQFENQKPLTGEWILENIADIRTAFTALEKSVRERNALLTF